MSNFFMVSLFFVVTLFMVTVSLLLWLFYVSFATTWTNFCRFIREFERGAAIVTYVSGQYLDFVLVFHVVGLDHLQCHLRNARHSKFHVVVHTGHVAFVHTHCSTCVGQRISVSGCVAIIVLCILAN